MKNYEKETLQSFLNDEEAVIKELKSTYNRALDDVMKKSKELQAHINGLQDIIDTLEDETKKAEFLSMKQAKVYQKQYQDALMKQINGILDTMHAEEFKTISEYTEKCYEEGWLGAMYSLHQQDIPIIMPIDQTAVIKAVQTDSKISQGLYTRLGEDVGELKKKISAEISRGISTGLSFHQIAQNLEGVSNTGYNNAVRIARTEGHRIQIQSAVDVAYKAKEKGCDVVKQWDSTLDNRTRPSHRKVDGEIRELDEPFSNGLMYPADSDGGAGEVVNCRCALLQRARWALDEEELEELKRRAEFFGLDKTDNFDDFKQKYLEAVEKVENSDIIKVNTFDIEGGTQKLKSVMSDADYKEYVELIKNNDNEGIQKLYAKYADGLNEIYLEKSSGVYSPSANYLKFSYSNCDEQSRYSTLAHEMSHFFDVKASYKGLNFTEADLINSRCKFGITPLIKIGASSSDEFLSAVRADKKALSSWFTKEKNRGLDLTALLRPHDGSAGVQDAIDGMFDYRIRWGHGTSYYNRKYKRFKDYNLHKELQSVYKELGYDASNQTKVKNISRDYETASEMWANIVSAIVCGGEELEYTKQYLPNAYEAAMKIIKGVE